MSAKRQPRNVKIPSAGPGKAMSIDTRSGPVLPSLPSNTTCDVFESEIEVFHPDFLGSVIGAIRNAKLQGVKEVFYCNTRKVAVVVASSPRSAQRALAELYEVIRKIISEKIAMHSPKRNALLTRWD
jgi:hypothetical protein